MAHKDIIFNEVDHDTEQALSQLGQLSRVVKNRFENIQTVLFVLSSKAMTFDCESLRQKTLFSYPDAAVFFKSTNGMPVGVDAPGKVDLVIDFTGPGERQWFTYARHLKKGARFCVGRNAGIFRKRIYDRIFDEKTTNIPLPVQRFDREAIIQKEVLLLAGISTMPISTATPNREKKIALDLPPMKG